MSQLLQYVLVILVLLGAIGLFMVVSISKSKRNSEQNDCGEEDTAGCSTCTEDCGLKREILEKSKEKRLQQPK